MKRSHLTAVTALFFLIGLIGLAGITPLAAKDGLITREYDVLDLNIPVFDTQSFTNYNWVSVSSQDSGIYLMPASFTGDLLVYTIKLLDKEWADEAKIEYQPATGKIIVTQTPEMHKTIQGFLAYLRGTVKPQVSLEARLIVIDNAVLSQLRELSSGSVILSEPALTLMAEKGYAYKTVRKTGTSGSLIPFSDLKLTAYHKDYDVVIVNATSSTALGEIVINTIEEGLRFNIRPIITPNKSIRLDIQLHDAALVAIDTVNPALSGECQANIELPTLDDASIKTSLIVPANRTILAGLVSLKEPGKHLAVLLTPSLNAEPAQADSFPIPGTNKVFKLFDFNSFVIPYPEHFLQALIPLTPGAAPIWNRAPSELPPVAIKTIDAIQAMIVDQTGLNLDGEIYADPTGGRLYNIGDSNAFAIIQTAEGIQKISEYVKMLAKPPELITVSAQLLSVEDAYWKTLIKDKKADLSKGVINPQALANLLAENGKGKVKTLAANQVTGSAGQSVLAVNYRISNYIQDVDIQAGAIAYEPVIYPIHSGSAINVKSIIHGSNIDIIIDWRFIDLLTLQPLTTIQGKFICHKPQLDLKLFNGNIRVQDGLWTIAQTTASRDQNGLWQNQILLIRASLDK